MSPRARATKAKETAKAPARAAVRVPASEPADQAPCAAQATREKILRSAENLFGEHGFDGVSVRQIALAAGVPVALINYHFGGKEGLYRAIFQLRSPAIVDDRLAACGWRSWSPIPTANWS